MEISAEIKSAVLIGISFIIVYDVVTYMAIIIANPLMVRSFSSEHFCSRVSAS